MAKFVILRHGSNAANQRMTQTMVVGIVEAESKKEARETAALKYTCYNNQHFEVLTEREATAGQWNEACEAEEAKGIEDAALRP